MIALPVVLLADLAARALGWTAAEAFDAEDALSILGCVGGGSQLSLSTYADKQHMSHLLAPVWYA